MRLGGISQNEGWPWKHGDVMAYLSLVLPIVCIYMANFYALRHDYRLLQNEYKELLNKLPNHKKEDIMTSTTDIDPSKIKIVPLPNTAELQELIDAMNNSSNDIEREIIYGRIQAIVEELKSNGKLEM